MTSNEVPTFHGGPLPFITISPDGSFVMEEYAMKILSQIKGKIAVITVTGMYRTGKSYLMNRLIGMQDGFEIGPTVNPCTKGIWIWGQPVQLAEDYFAILIDTEGLGSGNKASVDLAIFTLSILLSSFFIYNTMGAITEETLDQFAVVSGVVKSVAADADKKSFVPPPLLWVLRDFNLKLVNEYNQVVSPQDYLEGCLNAVSGSSTSTREKNAIRESIKQLFHDRNCLTMVRPVESESELRQINKVPFESLRPQFKQQVERFVETVYTNIEPKRIGKVILNGQMLTQLASQYCALLNGNQGTIVPGINSSAWSNVVQTQLRTSLRDAIGVYRSVLNDDGMKRLPLSDTQLKSVHLKAKALAREKFPTSLLDSLRGSAPSAAAYESAGDVNQSIAVADVSNPETYNREFRTRREQLLDHLKAENVRVSHGEIEKIFSQVVKQTIDPVVPIGSAPLLLESWRSVMAVIDQQCVPQYPSVAIAQFMSKTLIPTIISISAQHIGSMLSAPHAGSSELVSAERKKWTERVIQLETQLEENKALVQDLQLREGKELNTGKEVEKGLREMVRQLQDRLAEVSKTAGRNSPSLAMDMAGQATSSAVMSELILIKDLLVSSLTEIQSAESNKRSVEIRAENEKNLIELERKFNKQLNEARKKNELMIDDLKNNYENEVATLKQQKSELQELAQQLQRDASLKSMELEKLTTALAAAENDRNLKSNFANVINQQSELVLQFLRNGAQLSASQARDLEKATAQATEYRRAAASGRFNPGA